MAFSGLSTNKDFTVNLAAEDLSEVMRVLAPYEAPFLNWLGDADVFASSTKHEFVEDFLRPRYIITSTAIPSHDTNAAVVAVNGLGEALTVGTIMENESAAPELMQVSSIVGANTIVLSRKWDAGTVGSLAVGGSMFVRWPTAEEGHEHSGRHTARRGNRRANTVGYFSIEIAASGTQQATSVYGNDSYESARAKIFTEIPGLLESEVVRGKLNGANSLGDANTAPGGGRTMLGIRAQLTAINSAVAANSFAADPHLYLGNIWEQVYQAGASTTETWGIVAGRTFFRNISNLNASYVTDKNEVEQFKRVVRSYEGAFGQATVFLSRALPATECLLVPRERIKVVPLQSRSFFYEEMGKSGDNRKGLVTGEYSVEVHHPSAMGRLYV